NKIFCSFLEEVAARTLEAFENQDYQFEQLVQDLTHKWDRGRHPLFDAGFQFQGKEPGEIVSESAGGAIKISPYQHQGEVTVQADITIHGGEGPGNLVFRIDYSTALFNRSTIEGFAGCFREIVSSVLSNPDRQLKTIEIIPETEREKILSIIEKDRQTIQTDFDFD
ncbi:MAG: hypothetical protein GY950_02560, partial [bacterium]|nr:hypothetical protein [bacterium]